MNEEFTLTHPMQSLTYDGDIGPHEVALFCQKCGYSKHVMMKSGEWVSTVCPTCNQRPEVEG